MQFVLVTRYDETCVPKVKTWVESLAQKKEAREKGKMLNKEGEGAWSAKPKKKKTRIIVAEDKGRKREKEGTRIRTRIRNERWVKILVREKNAINNANVFSHMSGVTRAFFAWSCP